MMVLPVICHQIFRTALDALHTTNPERKNVCITFENVQDRCSEIQNQYINTGATFGYETEEEKENYILMHQETFFFYVIDVMVHEKTSEHRLDEQNNNRLAYQLKQQLILKALLTEQKSDTDSAGKHESELKSESKKVLQKAQEFLNQHQHHLEQKNHQCGVVIHHDSVQIEGRMRLSWWSTPTAVGQRRTSTADGNLRRPLFDTVWVPICPFTDTDHTTCLTYLSRISTV